MSPFFPRLTFFHNVFMKEKFSIKVHIDFSPNIDRMEFWKWIESFESILYSLTDYTLALY